MKLSMLFRILTTPLCWLRFGRTSLAWDKKLNELLDKHNFVPISSCRAQLGPYTLWIANHPYKSFYLMEPYEFDALPTRTTAFRAMDKLEHDIVHCDMAMGA